MKKCSFKVSLAVLLLLFTCDFAFAIRPLYTEDCWVTSPRRPVIESGVLLLSNRDNSGIRELVTSLKLALSDRLDLSIDLPYMSRGAYSENYDGLADGTFKIKYNFINNDNMEGYCFLLGYLLNTSDPINNFSVNHHHLTSMLIYSRDLGAFNYHLNFGYTFDDVPAGQEREDFIIYNASIVKPLTEKLNIMGELQYSKSTLFENIVTETAVGFNYKYLDDLIFDMALGCGLTEYSSSSNLAFGLTYLFKY